nr:hypothetical protein OH820_30390 [Streptomyces sp. NBC_00857]
MSPDMSDQMAWNVIYAVALDVARQHGATIPSAAHEIGPYHFAHAVLDTAPGLGLTWEGRTV